MRLETRGQTAGCATSRAFREVASGDASRRSASACTRRAKEYDRGSGGGSLLKREKWRTPGFLHFTRSGCTPRRKLATLQRATRPLPQGLQVETAPAESDTMLTDRAYSLYILPWPSSAPPVEMS